ncbi:hypothetical protein, partial [Escherichia coli]|uniref:hypothetical protein n=1 Tax=Escherichia coli TaxID=562 RepID=UPI0032D92C72
ENMSVEGLFVHGGDLWRLNTPLSCLQPPQQGKTHKTTANQTKPGYTQAWFFDGFSAWRRQVLS